jgi:hypothetical protein
MIDVTAERKHIQDLIAVEKAKRRPKKERIEFLQERIEMLDIIEGTRDDDDGFCWMLEVKEYSDVLKDDSICIIPLKAKTKDQAIKEVTRLLKREFKKKDEIKRVRLYQAHLTKQFRLDEIK